VPLLLRIYFNAVFGGLGGLLGWMLYGIFVDPRGDWPEVLQWFVGGLLIGGSIGYLVVSVEAIRDRSLVRFSRLASYGLLLGAAGGAVGFVVGEWINIGVARAVGADREGGALYMIGAAVARGLGWMVLGLLVGVSEGIAARSLGKFSYGAIGGAIGGFVGGALFFLFYNAAKRQAGGEAAAPFYGALGLVILGACIGSLSALVTGVFQPASVRVLRGWQEGREYPLDKPKNLLGRDEHADIALFRDMRIEKKHAYIQREGVRYFLVNNNAPADYTRVNGIPVETTRELKEGDRIELGQVVLRFQLRLAQDRRRKTPRAAS
jgi:Inner membrane component of T3SS, cytoplasmic domain